MMKQFFLPVFALIILFCASLGNARLVAGHVDRWCQELDTAQNAVKAGNWELAKASVDSVYHHWCTQQTYFHIVIEHKELDAAEALFARAIQYADEETSVEFRVNIAELYSQLQLLSEMEKISIKNIL